jgi:hypothetical protein
MIQTMKREEKFWKGLNANNKMLLKIVLLEMRRREKR